MDYKTIKGIVEFQSRRVAHRRHLPGMLDQEDADILKVLQKMEREQRPKPVNISFESFWELYKLKIARDKCKILWAKYSDKERIKAMIYIPKYLRSLVETGIMQKNPDTFLRNKCFNDQLRTAAQTNQPEKPQRKTEWI